MNIWLDHYRRIYYPLLNIRFDGVQGVLADGFYNRAVGFDIIFRLLLNQKQSNFNIVETGTLRTPGNWMDGQSARLFSDFVELYGGQMRSVDIDSQACEAARNTIVSDKFSVTHSDSVTWLQQQTDLDQVDLFYLDSYDVDWNDDTASAQHHLMEFKIIEPHLKPGAVVTIDDNSRWVNNNRRTGKGRAIVEYLETQGHFPIMDEYQIIFQF
jgi:hypothetical protein